MRYITVSRLPTRNTPRLAGDRCQRAEPTEWPTQSRRGGDVGTGSAASLEVRAGDDRAQRAGERNFVVGELFAQAVLLASQDSRRDQVTVLAGQSGQGRI